MKLSIITVVFNNVYTIGDTVASVASQREVAYEHLIIDGVSTDGTLAKIKTLSPPHLQLLSEPDSGIYNAMNKGIRYASGDIIGFLNADDVYTNSTVLAKVLQAFLANPNADIVFGDLVYVKEIDLGQVVRTWKSKPYYSTFFEDGHIPPHPAFFIRRSVLLQSGGFDEQFRIASDYELMFRLLKMEKRMAVYLPEVFVRMRLGGASNRSVENIRSGNQEIIAAWKKHKQLIPFRFWVLRYWKKVKQFF